MRGRIDTLLDDGRMGEWSWNRAYEVEQQLVHLYDDVSLSTEIGRRILEAEPHLSATLVAWYRRQVEVATDDSHRRALLLRLINDIQWRYTVKEAARNYTKQITQRTGLLFICAMVVFIASFLVVITFDRLHPSASYLMLASASGLWGGAFSMLTGLKGRLAASTFDDLKLARSWSLILARVLLGAGAAVVLYLFIRSGLLAGEAFPSLGAEADPFGGGTAWPDVRNLALFTVWCFIAGFSEKLVPGLLSRTEGAAADQSEPGRPDRSRRPGSGPPMRCPLRWRNRNRRSQGAPAWLPGSVSLVSIRRNVRARVTHVVLLVVDELGYLHVTQTGAMLFFQLINRRYERASTVLTSNKDFEEWAIEHTRDKAGGPSTAGHILK